MNCLMFIHAPHTSQVSLYAVSPVGFVPPEVIFKSKSLGVGLFEGY